jgi:hypothetical protein
VGVFGVSWVFKAQEVQSMSVSGRLGGKDSPVISLSVATRGPLLATAILAALSACAGIKQNKVGVDAGGPAGTTGTSSAGTTGTAGVGGSTVFGQPDAAATFDAPALPGFDAYEAPAQVVGSAPLGDAACAAQTQKAEQLPLDMYIMFDSSGSMADLTMQGVTKWDAVRTALTAFLRDPKSAGLGVGLQYFPLTRPGVPAQCLASGACGANGPCDILKTCAAGTTVKPCNTNADCGANDQCVTLGGCTLSPDLCIPVGGVCGRGRTGTPAGNQCVPLQGYCHTRDLCESAPYATPAVEVAPLPGAATALIASLTQHMPDGLTPTAGALAGAIAHAQALAKANPTHRVVVVLATDGFPSECTPVDTAGVAAIATAGLNGTPSISTFVFGVFAPADQMAAQTNLNAFAQAGGTKQAFVTNTDKNVSADFLLALNSIRNSALACQYKIPASTDGGALDYFQVNVQFTSGAGKTVTIGNVHDKTACGTKGGWYYDADPAAGGTPKTISICDQTCGQLQNDAAGSVDVLLGCKTEYIVQ